jgi:hypothetical protein
MKRFPYSLFLLSAAFLAALSPKIAHTEAPPILLKKMILSKLFGMVMMTFYTLIFSFPLNASLLIRTKYSPAKMDTLANYLIL